MPALTFDIKKDSIANLIDTKIELKDFLDGVLFGKKDIAASEISPWLLEFHKENGGAPVISGLSSVDCSYDPDKSTGQVKFAYKIAVSFGCADIFRTDDHTETCKFRIDVENQKLTLFITDRIMRDTVDEF